MRVITGIARGKKLETPNGSDIVRPTTDKVKEALFSIINFDIEGSSVLDLFAGSGQLGIEALSRGAKKAVFIDSDHSSAELTRRNVEACGFTDISKVIRADFNAFLNGTQELFDIAFIDPPYKSGLYDTAIAATKRRMSNNGIIACEHPVELIINEISGYTKKDYKYGKIVVTVFRKEVV